MRYLFALDPNNNFFGLLSKLSFNNPENALTIDIIGWVLVGVIAYLLGSLNSAIIVSKSKYKQDIRTFGSGNAGLTNMLRVYGKDGALLTLAGDIAKQFVSVLVGAILLGRYGAYLAGLFCMLGHIFPIYYRFKGGKGVLTAATMILLIDPLVFVVLFIIFALTLAITRYVSLSSIIAAITYPAALSIANGNSAHIFEIGFALFVAAVVIIMHRTNLQRLFRNEENKFSFKKKAKPETKENIETENNEEK